MHLGPLFTPLLHNMGHMWMQDLWASTYDDWALLRFSRPAACSYFRD
jgi:hypothetical protein